MNFITKLALIPALLLGISSYTNARCHTERVTGLDPYGDNFLAVRSGPSSRYSMKDTLHLGDKVGVCDYSGSWKFIYYGTGSCYLKHGEVRGNCRSGWVYGRYVR